MKLRGYLDEALSDKMNQFSKSTRYEILRLDYTALIYLFNKNKCHKP